jgi:hypothetical protein
MRECHHLLPDKDVVDHCTATEDDTQADKHTGHNGWSGVELDERVQNDAYPMQKSKHVYSKYLLQEKTTVTE